MFPRRKRGALPIPDVPIILSVAPPLPGTTNTRLQVIWNYRPNPANTYYVERSLNGVSGWTFVGTSPGISDNFVDDGLTAGVTYYYRVRVANVSGSSGYSNVMGAEANYLYLPTNNQYYNVGFFGTNFPITLTSTIDLTFVAANSWTTDSSERWPNPFPAKSLTINAGVADLVMNPDYTSTGSVYIQANEIHLIQGIISAKGLSGGAVSNPGSGGSGGGQGGSVAGSGYDGGAGNNGGGIGSQGFGFGVDDIFGIPFSGAKGGAGGSGKDALASGGGGGGGGQSYGGGGGGGSGDGIVNGGLGGGGGGNIMIVCRIFSGGGFISVQGGDGEVMGGIGGGGGGGSGNFIFKKYDGSLNSGLLLQPGASIGAAVDPEPGDYNLYELSMDETNITPRALSDVWDNTP